MFNRIYIYRIVNLTRRLREKLEIFDNGLDDRAMKNVKTYDLMISVPKNREIMECDTYFSVDNAGTEVQVMRIDYIDRESHKLLVTIEVKQSTYDKAYKVYHVTPENLRTYDKTSAPKRALGS